MQKHVMTGGGGGGGGGDDGEEEEEQRGQRSACKQTNQRFSGTIGLEVSGFSWVTDWVSAHHHLLLCGIDQSDNGKPNDNEHFAVGDADGEMEMFGGYGLSIDWLID